MMCNDFLFSLKLAKLSGKLVFFGKLYCRNPESRWGSRRFVDRLLAKKS